MRLQIDDSLAALADGFAAQASSTLEQARRLGRRMWFELVTGREACRRPAA